MSKDTTQLTMFTHEDLPLFSGTAPTAKAKVFIPKAAHRQEPLAECPICLDTGRVDGKPCWCQANGKEQVSEAQADVLDTKTFAKGTQARCNRCNAKSLLPKEVEGMRENSKVYRLRQFATLDCGHMDCHWVFIGDNPQKEPQT